MTAPFEMSVYCDLCAACLTAGGSTHEEARTKLFALVDEKHWRVVDRFDALDAGQLASTSRTPDLCCDCAAKL